MEGIEITKPQAQAAEACSPQSNSMKRVLQDDDGRESGDGVNPLIDTDGKDSVLPIPDHHPSPKKEAQLEHIPSSIERQIDEVFAVIFPEPAANDEAPPKPEPFQTYLSGKDSLLSTPRDYDFEVDSSEEHVFREPPSWWEDEQGRVETVPSTAEPMTFDRVPIDKNTLEPPKSLLSEGIKKAAQKPTQRTYREDLARYRQRRGNLVRARRRVGSTLETHEAARTTPVCLKPGGQTWNWTRPHMEVFASLEAPDYLDKDEEPR